MDPKTFLILLGSIITIIILVGIWFIATNISDQSRIQYETNTNRSEENYNRSVIIHDSLFDNITDLKKQLDPVLDTIDNATELKARQDRHYNQSFQEEQALRDLIEMKKTDHAILLNVVEMKKQDHGLIVQIIDVLNNLTTSVTDNDSSVVVESNKSEPIPGPIIIIENRTLSN